jgi:hypothetical protein
MQTNVTTEAIARAESLASQANDDNAPNHEAVSSALRLAEAYVLPIVNEVRALRSELGSLGEHLEKYGLHDDECPGSHPAFCTCLTGQLRLKIREALKRADQAQ